MASGVHTGQHSTEESITAVSLSSIGTDCWNLSTARRWPTTEERLLNLLQGLARAGYCLRSPGLPCRPLALPLSHSDCFTEQDSCCACKPSVPDRAAFPQKGTGGTQGLFSKACLQLLLTFKYKCFIKTVQTMNHLVHVAEDDRGPMTLKEPGCPIGNMQHRHR